MGCTNVTHMSVEFKNQVLELETHGPHDED